MVVCSSVSIHAISRVFVWCFASVFDRFSSSVSTVAGFSMVMCAYIAWFCAVVMIVVL